MPIKPALPQEPSSGEEDETQVVDESVRKCTTTHSNGATTRTTSPIKELDISDACIRDAILEAQIEEKRVAKRAEDRVKDHLAQAAREKLGMVTKEKQLQLERRKRAMAFLTQIKSSDGTTEVAGSNNQQPIIILETDEHDSTVVVPSGGERIISNGGTIEDDDDDDVQLISEKRASPRSRYVNFF